MPFTPVNKFLCVRFLLYSLWGLFSTFSALFSFVEKKQFQHHRICMSYISVTDNLLLFAMLASSLLENFPTRETLAMAKYTCKALAGLTSFGLHIGSFLLTSAVVERSISVSFPQKAKCVRVCAKMCLALFILMSLGLGVFWFLATEYYVNIHPVKVLCGVSGEISQTKWFRIVRYVSYCGLRNGASSAVCLLCTVVLGVQAKRQMQSTSDDNISRQRKEFRMSAALISIASIFLTGNTINLVLGHTFGQTWERDLIFPISALFQVLYHSVKFFVYLFALEDIRKFLLRRRRTTAAAGAGFDRNRSLRRSSRHTRPEPSLTD